MSGFRSMGPRGGAAGARPVGIGMLGYAFMGKAYAKALHKLAYMVWPPPLRPRLVSVAGRDDEAVGKAARRYGFARFVTDWKDVVAGAEGRRETVEYRGVETAAYMRAGAARSGAAPAPVSRG